MKEIPKDWFVTWTANGKAEAGAYDKRTHTFKPESAGLNTVSVLAYDSAQKEYKANKQYEVIDVQLQAPLPVDIPNLDEQGKYTGTYSALGSPPGGDYLWSKVSGPGAATIEPDVSANPTATYNQEGIYEIKVKYTYSEGQGITSTTSSPRTSAREGSSLSGGSTTQTIIVLSGFKAQEAGGTTEKPKKSKEAKSGPIKAGTGGGTPGGGTPGGGDDQPKSKWLWRVTFVITNNGKTQDKHKKDVSDAIDDAKTVLDSLGIKLQSPANIVEVPQKLNLGLLKPTVDLNNIRNTFNARDLEAKILRKLKSNLKVTGQVALVADRDAGTYGHSEYGLGALIDVEDHIADQEAGRPSLKELLAETIVHELLAHSFSYRGHGDGHRDWEKKGTVTAQVSDGEELRARTMEIAPAIQDWINKRIETGKLPDGTTIEIVKE